MSNQPKKINPDSAGHIPNITRCDALGFHASLTFSTINSMIFTSTIYILLLFSSFSSRSLPGKRGLLTKMPSRRGFQGLLYCVLWMSRTISLSTASRDACGIEFPGNKVVTSVQIVKHTVHIIASIASNTTLQISNDLTIPVDNAPTNLDLITTYETESTYLSTIDPLVHVVSDDIYSCLTIS